MKNIELKRIYRPAELPQANSLDLCKFFNSCNQRDIVMLILMNCQKMGFWTPTHISTVYSDTLKLMCGKNIIDDFGSGQYCLTNDIIKKIYHSFR